jgi:IclR family transcriptional regulator, mhp operon transcriptional activator
LDRGRVHGSINIMWIKTAFSAEEFAARHLGDLRAAAAEIVRSMGPPVKRSSSQPK